MANGDSHLKEFSFDAEMFYDALVKSTDNYVYIVDMLTDIALVSPQMYERFELPGRLVPGLIPIWGSLVHPEDKAVYDESIDKMLRGETNEHNVEYQIKNRKGEYIWVQCRGYLQKDDNGQAIMFAGVVNNLGSKGKIDYTTGLFTYRECEKYVDHLLEKKKNGGLLLIGLDDFVRINDLNTHMFGDAVLRQFAQSILQLLPPKARMYRFDGDEFAIVLSRANEQDMEQLYQKIHAYCNRTHRLESTDYYCTASAGIAMLGSDGNDYQELLKCAVSALELSKQKGKNNATFFSQNMMNHRLRTLELGNELQNSVIQHMQDFHLVFQPFVHSDTLELAGAEALLRWSCEKFQGVGPMEFIPVLESSGLIIPVGKWVLEEAIKVCAEWIEFQEDFIMNVNVSYLQLLDETFLSYMKKLLDRYQVAPWHIVLELTESCFVTDMGALQESFKKIRNLNMKVAMDDFGTGYSSLGMLSQMPADIVKIDRLFITAIHESKNDFNRSFIESVIQLCHQVGITVCVEGVEVSEELHAAGDLHADSIQGYFIAKPLAKAEFENRFWQEK